MVMALFEARAGYIAPPDDTARLRCTIKHAHTLDRHTEYVISVQAGTRKEPWSVSRRYRDFSALHAALQPADIPLPLPSKKLIGNMQPAFVAERQKALQNYLSEVLKHQILALSLPVRQFLDPKNYYPTATLSLHEMALQSVSIALRGDGGFELKGTLLDIGWRIRKRCFLVSNEQKSKTCLLSWQQYGPDRCLSDKDMQSALKCLQGLSHPYIDQLEHVHALECGAYAIRTLHAGRTVRDLLYACDYARCHLSKYGNPRVRRPFTQEHISHYGRQMLEALKFLHEKGLPYGHLHPGNVAITNQKILLLDMENGLLGAPSLYRPYILEHKSVNTMEAVDVYTFGHTVYEMVFAAPLDQPTCDIYPEISEKLESVLRLCLSSATCKHGLPSVASLLQHPLFTSGVSNGLAEEAPRLKFPVHLKEKLKEATGVIERRLNEEQKLLRSERREERIQRILSSEEEMRRQRRRARRRESAWRSASSLTEAHSVSTTSSPTPPNADTNHNSTSTTPSSPPRASLPSPSPSPAANTAAPPRAALLSAICSFNKATLQRINGT